ncbi:MAG: exodeoxyribonuclease V subunit gamma [Desulforegulaceae bacterium]|nr:exodeoxyribonuclease V subunit gamma [Desulforegulaceae bacterium]
MKNFNICFSNKIENLVYELSSSLKKNCGSVFEPEIIVVQSKGMEKYLSLELSKQLGIAANFLFLYPNSMLEYCLEKTGIFKKNYKNSSKDIYTWAIMELIFEFKDNKIFNEVLDYVKINDEKISIEKLYQLSEKIARLFKEYQIFRPEWILLWEENENEAGWQSFLWNRLAKKLEIGSLPKSVHNIFNQFEENTEILKNLPKRISVFGIFSLPKIYLDALNFFSKTCEVNLYLLNPCLEYWGEILSEKRIDKIKRKSDETNLYLESGNSLLASFGETGKVFFDILNEYEINRFDDFFVKPMETSILSCIQYSILNLFNYSNKEKFKISSFDNSVRIHSCHSPMREMEILKDNILYILDIDDQIEISDIIVMIPDIEKYSPYIRAVFGRTNDDKKIPFSIADRSAKSENKGLDCFFGILGIFTSRFEASLVIDLLEDKIIYEKFMLNEKSVEKIKNWVFDLKISWGLDSEFKKNMDFSPDNIGTWKKGLDILCLGHALSPDSNICFNSIFPLFEIDSSDQETLSGLMEFYFKIKKYYEIIKGNTYFVSEWADIFSELCDDFLYFENKNEFDFINLKKIFTDLKEEALASNSQIKVPFSVMYQRIEKIVSSSSSGYGFLDGRLTFCAMLPMRSIPFQMIAVCGLNEGDFPRSYFPPNFDLMARFPKKGDRHIRDDDKYLFLETIISARKYLYLSYIGNDIKTDSIIPPSSVLSEFTDYIEDNFISDKNIIKQITRNHFAPSFSSAYFKFDNPLEADSNGSVFSYSKRFMELSKDIFSEKKANFIFNDEPLKRAEESLSDFIDINSITGFFKNPQRFYLKINSIETGTNFEFFEDREIFNPDGLLNYLISNDLLNMFLKGNDEEICQMIMKSRNLLPYGKTGIIFYNKLKEEILFFLSILKTYLVNMKKISLDVNFENTRVKGSIDLYDGDIVLFRYGKIKPVNMIELWIKHNFVLFSENNDFNNNSIFAGAEKNLFTMLKFNEVEKNKEYLENLISLYQKGSITPLCFDPDLSYEYANSLNEKIKKNQGCLTDEIREEELLKIKNKMESANSFKDYSLIEKNFRGLDFINNDFAKTAETVLLPMINKIKEI